MPLFGFMVILMGFLAGVLYGVVLLTSLLVRLIVGGIWAVCVRQRETQ